MRCTSSFFGWRVVWATFVLALLGSGAGFYGPPVYLHAVIGRTGWPLTLVSTAVTVHFLVGAFVTATLPVLYRRFGVPTITNIGVSGLALGVLGWATAAEPWQLFAASVFSGAGWTGMGAAAINAIVAPWFVQGRPTALAIAYNGINVGGMIFVPLWVTLINSIDFAAASILVGVAMILVVRALSHWVFMKTPEELRQSPDGHASIVIARRITSVDAHPLRGPELWSDRRFLTLAAGMALGLFAQIGLLAHLFTLLIPAMGERGAGLSMSLATACAIAGRTITAWVMPRDADRRLVSCTSYLIQFVGSIILI